MKFPSLFTKTPQYQRFSYKPRFYDPQKDEMKEREERIRRELDLEKGEEDESTLHRSRIAGSFQAARRRSKQTTAPNVAIMRIATMLFIALFLIAFLQWGRPAMYLAFLIVPFYLYTKFKGNRK
jgi:uncharacterized membrane protein